MADVRATIKATINTPAQMFSALTSEMTPVRSELEYLGWSAIDLGGNRFVTYTDPLSGDVKGTYSIK